MNTFVKICGLRDAEDVSAAVAAGANAVGFVFAESVRRISPANARAAVEGLAEGVQRVAVLHHPSNDECQAMIEAFAPDVIQTDAEDFATLEIPAHIECWPVIREGRESIEAPDIYIYALQHMGLDASECIALEDSEHGLRSASGAGLKTIVTVNGYTRQQNFDGAVAVLEQLGQPGDETCVDVTMLRRLFG